MGCYIPNQKFQQLVRSVQKFIGGTYDPKKIPAYIHKLKLSALVGKPASFHKIMKIEEPKTRRLSKLINEVISAKCRFQGSFHAEGDARDEVGDFPVSGKTRPDFVLSATTPVGSKRAVMGVELKRLKAGIAQALPQLCGLLADLNINHYRNGANAEDCAIPGYVSNNRTVQFFGAYLMKKNVSSFCTLSRPLSFTDERDMWELSAWLEKLPPHLDNVFKCIKSTAKKRKGEPALNLKEHFFKPIRLNEFECTDTNDESLAHGNIITRIFRVYHELHENMHAREFVEFPVGLMALGHHRSNIYKLVRRHAEKIWTDSDKMNDFKPGVPLIVYKKLTGWESGVPPERKIALLFLEKLTQAVKACTQAGAVFLDLRAPNIMWKRDDEGKIQIRLVDFEHVYLTYQAVDPSILDGFAKDTLYNDCRKFCERDGVHFPDPQTNEHFFQKIEANIRGRFGSDAASSKDVVQTSEKCNESAFSTPDSTPLTSAGSTDAQNHADTVEKLVDDKAKTDGDIVEDMNKLQL